MANSHAALEKINQSSAESIVKIFTFSASIFPLVPRIEPIEYIRIIRSNIIKTKLESHIITI